MRSWSLRVKVLLGVDHKGFFYQIKSTPCPEQHNVLLTILLHPFHNTMLHTSGHTALPIVTSVDVIARSRGDLRKYQPATYLCMGIAILICPDADEIVSRAAASNPEGMTVLGINIISSQFQLCDAILHIYNSTSTPIAVVAAECLERDAWIVAWEDGGVDIGRSGCKMLGKCVFKMASSQFWSCIWNYRLPLDNEFCYWWWPHSRCRYDYQDGAEKFHFGSGNVRISKEFGKWFMTYLLILNDPTSSGRILECKSELHVNHMYITLPGTCYLALEAGLDSFGRDCGTPGLEQRMHTAVGWIGYHVWTNYNDPGILEMAIYS